MPLTIRDLRPTEDAESWYRVLRAALPFLVTTPRSLAWQAGHAPAGQRFRAFVAEYDGAVSGLVQCGIDWETSVPGQGFANVSVHPAHRRRGAGTALLAAAEDYLSTLGVSHIRTWRTTTRNRGGSVHGTATGAPARPATSGWS